MGAVVIFSGGLDSTTLLYDIASINPDVLALSFDYGQRHRDRELAAARAIAGELGVEHIVSQLPNILTGSALTSPDVAVPDGHYADKTMRSTVVPNRNMIMLSIAVGVAWARDYDMVAFAAHGGDHYIYPDCRPEFVYALNETVALSIGDIANPVKVLAPYNTMTKTDIVRRGASLGVPWRLTWSCYRGGLVHCGTCGTCVERREAFEQAGIIDPTDYLTSLTRD